MPEARVNGIRIHYEEHGAGYPLILAHGYSATLAMWERQVEALSAKYRLVLYDMRGHGQSEAPEDFAAYTMEAYAADQAGLLDHLGIEQAFVGGLSMGGMVALQFAVTYPERVRALLLCDTSAENPPGMAEEAERADQIWAVAQRFIAERGREEFAKRLLANFQRLPLPNVDPQMQERYVERMANASLHGHFGASKAVRARPSLLPRLPELAMPTLIIVGDRDPLVPAAAAMKQAIPSARTVLFSECGHGTAAWKPDVFNHVVLDFLEAVERGEDVAGLYVA
ncbi:MAG TPA: alpha/beta fold hydrolase [Dehalococcoidia bacterium]|nr:alpha/beta fold hydrolase [Dehalococcoidia bacterium]